MNRQTGKLILISGPSGTGKSTVIARLMRLRDDGYLSIVRGKVRISASQHQRLLDTWGPTC